MESPELLFVQHMFDLRKLENETANKAFKLLRETEKDALALLQKMEIGEMKTFPGKKARAEKYLSSLRGVLNTSFDKAGNLIRSDSVRLARLESEFSAKALKQIVGPKIHVVDAPLALSSEMIKSIVDLEPIDGLTRASWLSKMKRATLDEFALRIQVGMMRGESTEELIRRVRGTKALRYKDGILQGSTKRSFERTVRTTVNHASNRARFETLRKQKDVTNSYEFVATLDERTSSICQATDGKIFKYEDAKGLVPPLHPNCRSTIVPVVDWEKLGIEPPSGGLRESVDGPVSSKQTYNTWLKKQSPERQNAILGPTRAALFRAGKVDLDGLVRTDGRRMTLEELERKHQVSSLEEIPLPKTTPLSLYEKDIASGKLLFRNALENKDPNGAFLSFRDFDKESFKPDLSLVLTRDANRLARALGYTNFRKAASSNVTELGVAEMKVVNDVVSRAKIEGLLQADDFAKFNAVQEAGQPIVVRHKGEFLVTDRAEALMVAKYARIDRMKVRLFDMDSASENLKKAREARIVAQTKESGVSNLQRLKTGMNARIGKTVSDEDRFSLSRLVERYVTRLDSVNADPRLFSEEILKPLSLKISRASNRSARINSTWAGRMHSHGLLEMHEKAKTNIDTFAHEMVHFFDFRLMKTGIEDSALIDDRLAGKLGINLKKIRQARNEARNEWAKVALAIEEKTGTYPDYRSYKTATVGIRNKGEFWRPSNYALVDDQEWLAESGKLYMKGHAQRELLKTNAPKTFQLLDDLFGGRFFDENT